MYEVPPVWSTPYLYISYLLGDLGDDRWVQWRAGEATNARTMGTARGRVETPVALSSCRDGERASQSLAVRDYLGLWGVKTYLSTCPLGLTGTLGNSMLQSGGDTHGYVTYNGGRGWLGAIFHTYSSGRCGDALMLLDAMEPPQKDVAEA